MNQIPKIIHQSWKNNQLTPAIREMSDTWMEQHPGWTYRFWTDDDNHNFVATHYPDFFLRYKRYPTNIQRADAARYLILLKYGGVYADLDMICLKNIEPLLENATCLFGLEPTAQCERFNKDKIICNAFMAAAPEHSFFHHIFKLLMQVPIKQQSSLINVLNTTGPFLLTRAYDCFDQTDLVSLLSSSLFYPIATDERATFLSGTWNAELAKRIDRAYAVHLYWGSWWKELL